MQNLHHSLLANPPEGLHKIVPHLPHHLVAPRGARMTRDQAKGVGRLEFLYESDTQL